MLRQPPKCLLLLSLLTTFTFSCRKSNLGSKQGDPKTLIPEVVVEFDYEHIKERGYLTALIDNSSTGLFLYRGKTMGYEYDLLKMFADSMGLDLRLDVTTSIEEAFQKLNKGEGDILAYNLTVTKERKKRIAFTHYHNIVRQVLIQRKPENWRQLKYHEIEKALLRNPVDLIGKEVHVRHHSAYLTRLRNLSDEIGGDILIIEDFPNVETETIIQKVAKGEIDYTVAEEDIALVNSTYYPILDIKTAVSFPQQIAWGVRRNSDSLLTALNGWIEHMRKTSEYYTVYNKYFRSSKASLARSRSRFSSLRGTEISPFDSLIKIGASELSWDWRLLAAQIYKESKFKPKAVSWAGAIGLMQVLPMTAAEHNVKNLKNPAQNIHAGVEHLKWLLKMWEPEIEDATERIKFVLASYNVGHGHVFDAIRLADKYGADPRYWENVAPYLIKKSEVEYFNDEVVVFGYCRGLEPVRYVKVILETFENYKTLFPEDEIT
ncbi:MAG: transporter substrate-binding domain-containing protein [Cyclobacteriaceae bacterium]|nr:transporter substrate-binding domain-containing protein [Cyclobacteriaceae bacterium HetDA_MAG_MS6]